MPVAHLDLIDFEQPLYLQISPLNDGLAYEELHKKVLHKKSLH